MVSKPKLLRRAGYIGAISVAAIGALQPATSETSRWQENAVAGGFAAGAHSTRREGDGLFYLNGEVNGTMVRFLVDTGASIIVLTPADAQRIGVTGNSRSTGVRIQTASGSSAMRWARLERVRVGGREVRDLDAAIVAEGLNVSLLGQNALTRLGSVTIAGNELHLN